MRAAEAAHPVGDDELDTLFASIAATTKVAIAVSGGADSLALLLLIDRWRQCSTRRPAVVVLTVDHGLRPGSRGEAEMVVGVATARGLPARLLSWTGAKPKSDLEAAAREARYRLLMSATLEEGASHLLLAHHQDDQAETFLMRLSRGSGAFGLAAMRGEVKLQAMTILRPFLALPRARLAATVAEAGLTPVEDAMNSDPRFLRARMRALLPRLAVEGLGAEVLAATAARLRETADAIDAGASRLLAETVTADEFAVAVLAPTPFFTAPEAVRRRALVRLLLAIGGDAYAPRSERLSAILSAIGSHGGGRFKRTLAGAVAEFRQGRFLFYREFGRDGLPRMAAKPGANFVWDHRFQVAVGLTASPGLVVAPLGEGGRRLVTAPSGLPAGAVAALPALWRGEDLLGVPSLGFRRESAVPEAVTIRCRLAARLAEPPLFPEFGPG